MEGLIALIVLAVVAMPILVVVALVKIATLNQRIGVLERRIDSLASRTRQPSPASTPEPDTEAAPARPVQAPVPTIAQPPPAADPAPWNAPAHGPGAPATGGDEPPAADSPPPLQRPGAEPASRYEAPSGPTPLDRLLGSVRRWFTEGNVPVKIGVLVLFVGVAALLKYVVDQGWMRVPIELRLAGIALAALAGLGLGWHQRERRRSFSLAIQGGAIGILLMTVFAAFRLYSLLPAGAALALSVVLVAGSGVLAVAQNAIALAVLGILAGFLAPVLMSTGGGDHVALFSYYALLNAAIFAVAWHHSWRPLNLLGFVFTFGIGVVWGVLDYRPEHLASTLPFLGLFFGFYLLIPILHARNPAGRRSDAVDGALVFGTPLVSFALLAGLLDGARLPLAFCALALAALYALLAWRPIGRAQFRTLAQCHALLAIGFATLAVPLALSAHATASVFAIEGAALVWLGLRQNQPPLRWIGALLQGLSALGYAHAHGHPVREASVAIANAGFMAAGLLALAGFASAWSYRRAGDADSAARYCLWGLAWWLAMAAVEIDRFVPQRWTADAWLLFAALTAGLAALAIVRQRASIPLLAWTVAAGLAAALPLAIVQSALHGHPFAGYGLPAWAFYGAAGAFALHAIRRQADSATAWAHSLWLLAWPLAASLWLERVTSAAGLSEGWRAGATALPWLLASAGLLLRPDWIASPLADRFDGWRKPITTTVQFVLALIWLQLLAVPGSAAPLPWVPVLNPVELAALAGLGLLAAWLWSGPAPDAWRERRVPILALAAFATISAITLRCVHHLGGVPWDAALWQSPLAQASLSLVWSVLGVAGWVLGSRRNQRMLWLAGAALMAVVLAKLILVDRQHLGNLLGIVSFIGYGLLCTAVGYVAPAPPRGPGPAQAELDENAETRL